MLKSNFLYKALALKGNNCIKVFFNIIFILLNHYSLFFLHYMTKNMFLNEVRQFPFLSVFSDKSYSNFTFCSLAI